MKPSDSYPLVSADLFNIVAQGEWVLQGDELRLTQQPELRTTSLAVATVFGKNHFHVLRAIRDMECSEEFRRLNFKETTYLVDTTPQLKTELTPSTQNCAEGIAEMGETPTPQSNFGLRGSRCVLKTERTPTPLPKIGERVAVQSRPMVEMTRKGFEFLVLGFTGRKAAQFREAYIERFHQMEAELIKKTNEIERLARFPEHMPYVNGMDLTGRKPRPYRIKNSELKPIPGVSIRQTLRGDGSH